MRGEEGDAREEGVSQDGAGAGADGLQQAGGALVVRQAARDAPVVHVERDGDVPKLRHGRQEGDDVDALRLYQFICHFLVIQNLFGCSADPPSLFAFVCKSLVPA